MTQVTNVVHCERCYSMGQAALGDLKNLPQGYTDQLPLGWTVIGMLDEPDIILCKDCGKQLAELLKNWFQEGRAEK